MLSQLLINNFTIINDLEIQFESGLTVITGATGAGKSILTEALGLTLGMRGSSSMVAPNKAQAELCAAFELTGAPRAMAWLAEHGFHHDGDSSCILRRLISKEGKSRAYINGQLVSVRELQTLGIHLGAIYGQHAHFEILNPSWQSTLLTSFGKMQKTAEAVRTTATAYMALKRRINNSSDQDASLQQRLEVLSGQISDLKVLLEDLQQLEQLHDEQRRLSGIEELLSCCHQALELLNGERGLSQLQNQLTRLLQQNTATDSRLLEPLELLHTAETLSQDASRLLSALETDYLSHNPQQLAALEERLLAIHQAARLHGKEESELADHYDELCATLASLEQSTQELADSDRQLTELATQYRKQASEYRNIRESHCGNLDEQVNRSLADLAMPHCHFETILKPRPDSDINPDGSEQVSFLVSTNPGHPAMPLSEVASGGELSRLSLALQIITSGHTAPPCLVFDEVDTGVGSAAASAVGRLLKQLSQHNQVLCVTHLAQVAGPADHHLVVSKDIENEETRIRIEKLSDTEERAAEIARMLGGEAVSAHALAHAKEILNKSRNQPGGE